MKQKRKKLSEKDMMLKAFRKANREIELERNGGRWTATTKHIIEKETERLILTVSLIF